MAWLKKLFGSNDQEEPDVDYYREGLELLKVGRYHDAVTSFRLALREAPRDCAVLQQIAIAYTRIGMTDEARKTYQRVLEIDTGAAGAHYGIAFLLLRDGHADRAADHLRRFLDSAPEGAEAERHIRHARRTLVEITGESAVGEGV